MMTRMEKSTLQTWWKFSHHLEKNSQSLKLENWFRMRIIQERVSSTMKVILF